MKVLELHIFTPSIQETQKFYHDILGMKIISKTNDSIQFQASESQLIFTQNNISQNQYYHYAFNVPKGQLENVEQFLLTKIDLLAHEEGYVTFFENWNAKALYCYDNNNNIVEFIERENAVERNEQSFNIQSILNISEVGIGNDQPLILAEELIELIGIDYYERGPIREDFVAMGNDSGLFVISNLKRNWYPTSTQVQASPLRVLVEIDNKTFDYRFNY